MALQNLVQEFVTRNFCRSKDETYLSVLWILYSVNYDNPNVNLEFMCIEVLK